MKILRETRPIIQNMGSTLILCKDLTGNVVFVLLPYTLHFPNF